MSILKALNREIFILVIKNGKKPGINMLIPKNEPINSLPT